MAEIHTLLLLLLVTFEINRAQKKVMMNDRNYDKENGEIQKLEKFSKDVCFFLMFINMMLLMIMVVNIKMFYSVRRETETTIAGIKNLIKELKTDTF